MAQPSIRVVGVYSPAANADEYRAFLDREVRSRNPVNFSEEAKAFLRRTGREGEIVELPLDELDDIREHLDRELSAAVLVEALVEHADDSFNVGEFIQADPERPPGSWQVAWCEKYLTPDGSRLLGECSFNQLPSDPCFRVVFYIHEWKQELGLNGPYGALELPAVQPMPARLWCLAPYEEVD